jgi:hypothetical protein
MKTIQHLCAMAIITIILGVVYESVLKLNGSVALQRTIFLGWVLSLAVVSTCWLIQFYHCKYQNHE